ELMVFIKAQVPDVRYEVMVDTGELVDSAVAERAGIGFTGKNTLLITEEFGSFVYLGEILISIPFTPDEPLQLDCGECRKCIDRSEEHTSELQSRFDLVCRLLLEKKKR